FTGRYSYLLYFHTLKSCFLHTSPKYRSIPDFYLVGIKIVDLFRNYLGNVRSNSPHCKLSLLSFRERRY
ncbi:MAG: hypothetical protein E7244_13420, partial [Enterocloster citroniae]|nr:hypothetical protein [Enterocloster citroniae]